MNGYIVVILLLSMAAWPGNSWGALSHFDAPNERPVIPHPNGSWTTVYGALGTAMLGLPNGTASNLGTAVWRDPSKILYSSPTIDDPLLRPLTSPLGGWSILHPAAGHSSVAAYGGAGGTGPVGQHNNNNAVSGATGGSPRGPAQTGGNIAPPSSSQAWHAMSGWAASSQPGSDPPGHQSPDIFSGITDPGTSASNGGSTTNFEDPVPGRISLPEPTTIVLWTLLGFLCGHHIWRRRAGTVDFGGRVGVPSAPARRRGWSEENRQAILQIIEHGRRAE